MVGDKYQKTIDWLNPWQSGGNIALGIERADYLKKLEEVVLKRKQIVFVLGSRRVGKTMILYQYVYKLIKSGVNPRKILFLSLDNTNLEGIDLYAYLVESEFDYVILDEVHYFRDWAKILKSLYDLPIFKTKIICSGSSSKLIEDNKALLTGRSTSFNVLPLNFLEFKEFNGGEVNEYLKLGGYPEYVLEKQPNYLNDLLRDIVEKDILKLHRVQNSQYLFDVCGMLARQVGFKNSPNRMANVLRLDNKTVVNYLQYLREVWLVEGVYQFSESINRKLYAPKKYYFNDLGMRNSFVGFNDLGSLVENAVFIKLRELFGEENIFYLNDSKGNEVDFVVKINSNEVMLVEVKYSGLTEGVVNSLGKLFFKEISNKKIVKRMVVTDGINDVFKKGGVEVEMVGLEKWLDAKRGF